MKKIRSDKTQPPFGKPRPRGIKPALPERVAPGRPLPQILNEVASYRNAASPKDPRCPGAGRPLKRLKSGRRRIFWMAVLFYGVSAFPEMPSLRAFSDKPSGLKTALFQSKNKKLTRRLNRFFRGKNPSRKSISKYLLENHYFKSQVLRAKQGWVIENPVKTVFSVRGVKFFNHYEINRILYADEARSGVNLYKTALSALRTAYGQRGFQKTKASYQIKREGWTEWVFFTVKEGPRIRIGKIYITGLLSQPPETYAEFIRNNSTDLVREGYYNKTDLEKGYKNLITHLKSQGYLESRLHSDRVIYRDDRVEIMVNLEEGPRAFIKSIELSGNKNISSGEILSAIESQVQSPLRLKVLEGDLSLIEEIYRQRGYLNAEVQKKNIVKYGENSQYVTVDLNITEGARAFVAEIIIEGNVRVKKKLIKNLLAFEEGTVLTPKKIAESINALSSLGLFSRVFIEPKEEDPSRIVVSVREKKTQDIRGGMGVNTKRDLTARAYGEYRHKNLFGRGRNLFGKISGQMNLIHPNPLLEYEISGIYQEVFIPGKNIRGNVGLSRSHDIFNYTKDINAVRKDQISFSIDKKLTSHLKSNVKLWSLEARRETCLNNPNCPENPRRIGSAHISFQYDKRDGVFNPKKGGLFSVKGEYASPLIGSSQDIQFQKLNVSGQLYHSLKEYVFALGLKGGVILSERSIPASHSFILGGQSSLRGYDGNVEGERIPASAHAPIDTANDSLRLKIGDSLNEVSVSQYALMKLELRFPVMKNVKGLVFYDAGLVRLTAKGNTVNDYGHSAGVGFRYETLVPIGVDIAYKLPPRPSSPSHYRFHIAIGLF